MRLKCLCARLSNVKITSENAVLCCEKENVSNDCDAAFYDAIDDLASENKKIDVSILNYVIKQKDALINELQERIKVLNNHIELLIKVQDTRISTTKSSDKNLDPAIDPAEHAADGIKKPDHVNKQKECENKTPAVKSSRNQCDTIIQKRVISKKEVAPTIMEVCSNATMERYININNDQINPAIDHSEGKWQEVRPKHKRRNIVVGKNEKSAIKGTPKITYLHVYRVSPNTTADDMLNMLKPKFPEATCELLNSKHPEEYASFKVGLYESHFEAAMNPEVWPTGTYVNRFLEIRRRVSNTVN
nr:unnamed protein product [Callosobruchus analis]